MNGEASLEGLTWWATAPQMAIVLTRDTVGACCCTASFGFPSFSVNGSCEGSEVNMSFRKASFRRYLSFPWHGDCAGITCRIGGCGEGAEVNTSARKVSLRRYLSFSSLEGWFATRDLYYHFVR